MPGYVIHLSVASEYIRKNKNEIKNTDEFLRGAIDPDLTDNKSKTHYGPQSSETDLSVYLKSNNPITDYEKGYFLHLITDYIFYKKYYSNLDERVYDDYSKLNEILITKYNVKILKEVEIYMNMRLEGEPELLNKEIIFKFIEEVSNWKLDEVKKIINQGKDII